MNSDSLVLDKKLKEIITILVDNANPLRIILFGSYAKGTNQKYRDYDICVIKENTEDLNKLEKKLYVDLHSVGEAIDLIVSSPERYETSKESKYSIYSEIAKNGLVVYERLR